MNGLSARERRLIVVLGIVLLLMAAVWLLGRRGGAADVGEVVPPSPAATSAPGAGVLPSVSPTFAIPPGARDPFTP